MKAIAVLLCLLGVAYSDPSAIMGGGNFDDGSIKSFQFPTLNWFGYKMVRVNLYPGGYYNDNSNVVVLGSDEFFTEAHKNGITPMVLFEYYASFPNPVGSYAKWHAIGAGWAKRYGVNGDLWKSLGVTNYGVTIFSAFNEPEGTNLNKTKYHDALEGLADGVHSINPAFKVNPGGFKNANAFSDYTLDGYGTQVADLWNSRKLDGIDLHTYFDVQYAPMEGTYRFSGMSNFQSVKAACKVTADVNFYTTEFNYKIRATATQSSSARGLVTAIFDMLGTVKNDGKTGATQFAFIWNIFNTNTSDPNYGLAVSDGPPYVPTLRANAARLVSQLTAGMEFVSRDPLVTGTYVLEQSGGARKMWVFQNRQHWSTLYGTSFNVTNIPANTNTITQYGWNGVRSTVTFAAGTSFYEFKGLSIDETLMFVATKQ